MPRPKKQEATKSQFVDLYPKLRGNITVICIACKISRRTFYDWMRDDPQFKKEIEEIDIEEMKLDLAEHQLDNLIKEKHWGATKFFLEKRGIKRGYGETQEIRHSGSIALEAKPQVNFTKSKKIEDED